MRKQPGGPDIALEPFTLLITSEAQKRTCELQWPSPVRAAWAYLTQDTALQGELVELHGLLATPGAIPSGRVEGQGLGSQAIQAG